jgi:hypothetical protein
VPGDERWRGRTVKVVEGTTVSMPDTPANARRRRPKDYPHRHRPRHETRNDRDAKT